MNREPNSRFNLVSWSVDHPTAIVSFFAAMLLLGFFAVTRYMPRRFMPYIESPMLGIVTEMPGLAAQEMETYFSAPIEQKMVALRRVRFVRSLSQDGFSMVVLEYPYGTDMQRAQIEVQSLLNSVQADLPSTGANLKPSWVLQIDPLNLPVLSLSLTGDKSWDMARLRDFADNIVVNRFKTAGKNIYTVSTFGGYKRQLQVRVDRDKIYSYGLSLLDVRKAIDDYNVAKPAGQVTNAVAEPIFRINTLAQDAETVRKYPIKAIGDKIVRVADVAEVLDTVVERRSAYHHMRDGKVDESIEVNILQNPDASSPVTIQAINKVARSLEKEFPGIRFNIAYDNSSFVGILFDNMYEELGIAILLTGLAVLFFLGEWRGTAIAITAIPTSLAMSLVAMAPLGMSLNSSTLVGLLIAIGRLVDDAIIDIHAVERHMRMGKDRKTATIDGITEVRRSVLAATIVLIVAIIPLMVSGGITQLMFVGLGLPIIFGLIFSYLVSMTLTAVLCSRFLQAPEDRPKTWFAKIFLQPFERGLQGLERAYERLIRWMLANPLSNFVQIGLTIVVGFGFYYFIGSEMMPLGDVGQASMQMEMQPGTSFGATENAVRRLEQILKEEGGKQGWIKSASIEIGNESGPGMSSGAYYTGYSMNVVNGASGMLTLSDKDSGRPDVWTILDTIHSRALKEIPGLRRIQLKEMGSDVMATSLAPVSLVVHGDDLNTLNRIGQDVLRVAKEQVKDIAQPFISWQMSKPTYVLQIDQDKAAAHGLSPSNIAEQAYYSLRGGYTSEFYRLPNKRPLTIQVRFKEEQRQTPEDLQAVFITGKDGEQVPLTELATLKKSAAPSAIEHDQLQRSISFGGYYRKSGRPSMDVTMALQSKALLEKNWPPGYDIEMRGDMTQMMDSFRVMLIGLGIALLLMYFILATQFGSFLQPLQMLFSLPLELSGVFFLLWLTNQAFSTVSILGIIILSGMDIVTAILLIDLILTYRRDGMPRDEAIAKAAPQRLRPILMTSLITIFVMSGVAFWPKTGMDAYQPLGTVIIGGLIVGTILSLLDIPVLHALVDELSKKTQKKGTK